MSHVIDDKSEHCIAFLLQRLHIHREKTGSGTPFFLGLNGVQGAGKTTLVRIHLSTCQPYLDLSDMLMLQFTRLSKLSSIKSSTDFLSAYLHLT